MALAIAAEIAVNRNNAVFARQKATCMGCALRARGICGGVPDTAVDRLAAATGRQHVAAGEIIFGEGDAAEHIVKVTSGTVEIFKMLPDGRRQVIGFLFAGDCAGIAVGDAYVYSAEAVTEVNLCRFPRRQLRDLLQRFPAMERRLLRMTVNELSAAQDQMVLLGRKTAAEKIASLLLMLYDRTGQDGSQELSLPMTRADIADYLGLTTETVSRTMTTFRKRGSIRLLDANTVLLVDRDDLESLAMGGC